MNELPDADGPVSPSPLMPIAIILRFAITAPVPTDGMRPCTS